MNLSAKTLVKFQVLLWLWKENINQAISAFLTIFTIALLFCITIFKWYLFRLVAMDYLHGTETGISTGLMSHLARMQTYHLGF